MANPSSTSRNRYLQTRLEQTLRQATCQTPLVPLVGRFWPLIASIGVHAALATAVVSRGAISKSQTVSRPLARDIWIGDTLEAAEPAAPTPMNEGEPTRESPRAESPTKDSAPRMRPVAEARPAVQRTAEATDSLAQRILAYRPKSGTAESEKDPDVGRIEVDRGKVGGMAGNEDEQAARGFAKAFTRALPAANTGDPIWGQLPLGPAGFVRVSVTVGADGSIDESRIWDKPHKPPSHLARLVDRTLVLLRGGRFALTNRGAGTETLRLDVTLSERPMESGPLALGFETPSVGSPGRAYFQLASGRFVEAKVAIERR